MDFEIRKLEAKLIEDINNSQIPIEVKRLVLAEVMEKVVSEANKIVQMQAQEEAKGEDNGIREDSMG